MAIISGDIIAIEEKARKLGVGELYGLFACMTSGRSWDAIQAGIDVNHKTESEEKEIKNDAAKYVVRNFSFPLTLFRSLFPFGYFICGVQFGLLLLYLNFRWRLWKFFIAYHDICFWFWKPTIYCEG